MIKKYLVLTTIICLAVTWIVICNAKESFVSKTPETLTLTQQDRILILAPHPDDEVLGCGGIIQRATKMNLPIKVVFLTYGDQNQWSFILYRKRPVIMPKAAQQMGLVRHDEALEADKVLGISPDQLIFLGYPDFRTLAIWYSHWGKDTQPARSILTDVREVPYKNAFRPGTPYKADEILKDLKTIIEEFKPTKIFVSHPSDHNPDHQSLYLFTRVALWDLENELKTEVYPYLIHFKRWSQPNGYHPNNQLLPPNMLSQNSDWGFFPLEPKEVTTNYNAIKKHRSQYNESAKYLLSFIRANELFGDFPVIDLKKEAPVISLESDREEFLQQMPEELLDEEKSVFVGLEKESLHLEDDALVYSLNLSRPLGETVGLSLFVFGYSKNTPFSEMPKIHIKFGALEHKILDQNHSLPLDSINIERHAKEINVRIPLKLIGNPDRILTSSNTYIADVLLDWTSWRIVEIKDNK